MNNKNRAKGVERNSRSLQSKNGVYTFTCPTCKKVIRALNKIEIEHNSHVHSLSCNKKVEA